MGKQKTVMIANKRSITTEEYEALFKDYPDVMDVKEVMIALGVCRHSVYKIMKSGQLSYFTVGRIYKIAKISLIEYVVNIGFAG